VAEQSPTLVPESAKATAYVAFCRAIDRDLLERLIEQGRREAAPFEVIGSSLDVDAGPGWESRVATAVARADLVIAVFGTVIHALVGFQREAEIACELGKPVIALYEHAEDFGSAASQFAKQAAWTPESLSRAVNELLASRKEPRRN